jgi:hypothetical protein
MVRIDPGQRVKRVDSTGVSQCTRMLFLTHRHTPRSGTVDNHRDNLVDRYIWRVGRGVRPGHEILDRVENGWRQALCEADQFSGVGRRRQAEDKSGRCPEHLQYRTEKGGTETEENRKT